MSEQIPTGNQDQTEQTSSEGMVTVRLTNQNVPQPPQSGWTEVTEDWREVGEEFKKLGVSLGSAIRTGWKRENDQQLTGLGDQLRAMADQVEAAVRTARQEAQAPETKVQTQRVVAAAREAGTTLVDEVRDTVATGLRRLNGQLRELAERIETGRK